MDLTQKIILEQTKKICEIYKISPDDVKKRLQNKIDQNNELLDTIKSAKNTKKVYRTRVFKDFIKKTKKEIYYDLRTYQKSSNEKGALSQEHVSTKERSPYLDSFFEQVDEYVKNAETVLDIGGGLFPAQFPFDNYLKLKHYIWIDKDKRSYQKLKKQNYKNVNLYNHHIGQNKWEQYLPKGKTQFDFVFMLKLVPVIARQEKQLLKTLTEIPFKRALITGSKEAMVKKVDIEKREYTVIRDFIENAGFEIVKKIDTPNEFGYIVN